MLINLDGEDYYLVYEKSKPQDWIFLGLVQADIVNASMNVLQRSTVLLVSAVAVCIAGPFYWNYSPEKQGKPEEKGYGDPVQGRIVSKAVNECR